MAQDVDGRRIAGRYELGVQLGEGGVGIVWRAEDTLLGRPVAIKEVELPPAVRDKQRAALRARVIREARAAARLSHPGAVTQFDVLNSIVNDPPRQARRLGALGPVVDRLLRKESHQRPKSADVWYQLRRVAATKDPADEVPPDPPSTPIPRPTPHAVKAPPTGPAQAKAAPTGTDPAADVPVGTVPAEAKSAVGASASAAPDAAARPRGAPASAGPADGAARGTSAGAAPGRPTSAEGVPPGANPGAADSAGAAPDSGAAGGGTWLRRRRRRSGG